LLPARSRLTRQRDFLACYRRGERASDRLLAIARLARAAGCRRLGVSVSRKVGKSVVRNQVKRWIREAARNLVAEPGPSFDLVVSARPAAAAAGYHAIRDSLTALLRRAAPGARAGRE
jgi:ribonuclease P protein component